jgi:predicted GNAT family acetyltransferase
MVSVYVIDGFHVGYENSLCRIQELATRELRTKYIPRKVRESSKTGKGAVLVALEDDTVVGVAEYFQNDDFLYIQGIAVHPDHRE